MKKNLFLIILCLFVGKITAQISEGARLVSGSLNANYNWSGGRWSGNQGFSANLASSYSYFSRPNRSKNIGLGIRTTSRSFRSNVPGVINSQRNTNLAISFQFGYTQYFPLAFVNKHLFLAINAYVSPEAEILYNTNSMVSPNNPLDRVGYGLGVSLGLVPSLAFRLKERWLLSANLGLANFKYELNESNGFPIHSINTNFNLNPAFWGIGIGYFLAPKS